MLSEQDIRLILDKTGKGRNCIDEKLSLGDYLPEYKTIEQAIVEVKEEIKKVKKTAKKN